jgi:glycosyltransferase involved in cell wall biosynthesis
MKIYAHCLVQNEENFLWYSVASIVEHVDKVMIWDNGSSDRTFEIIKELRNKWPDKIISKKFSGTVSVARQKMLDETDADWIIILDGDEIWWENSIRHLVSVIDNEGSDLDSIVVPFKNLIGDMFHYQSEDKGKYNIDGKTGFLTIRAINNKIEGLKVSGKYPFEGYANSGGILIQNLDQNRRMFLDAPYLHLTHLKRSSKKSDKIKYRFGVEFPKDFYYPEVIFKTRPKIITSIWTK